MDVLFQCFEAAYRGSSTSQLIFELMLVSFVVWVLARGRIVPDHKSGDSNLQEASSGVEVAHKIENFQPETLFRPLPADHYALKTRVVSGRIGRQLCLDGQNLLNLATFDHLGLSDREETRERVAETLRKFGVGSCGPRAFFGTTEVHLAVENAVAKFLGVEEACLYSSAFASIASAIPAYVKRGDVVFADEQLHFPIQQGILSCRCEVHYFQHNNPEDLERLLKAQDVRDASNRSSTQLSRRFLIIEGIYKNTGVLADLPALAKLRKAYKCRLIIDESVAFGVLGNSGRGTCEHFKIPLSEIDLIHASLEHSMSAYGGFIAGSRFFVDHQRLSGIGYIFSASLPPIQAAITLEHIELLAKSSAPVHILRKKCLAVHALIETIVTKMFTTSDALSPIKYLYLEERPPGTAIDRRQVNDLENINHLEKFNDREKFNHLEKVRDLEKIVSYSEERGIALNVARFLKDEEHVTHEPAIRLTVNSLLSFEELERAINILEEACANCITWVGS